VFFHPSWNEGLMEHLCAALDPLLALPLALRHVSLSPPPSPGEDVLLRAFPGSSCVYIASTGVVAELVAFSALVW